MPEKRKAIPVRSLARVLGDGIAVAKVSSDTFLSDEEALHAHRHDYHFFVLHEKGCFETEIDFEKYLIDKPAIQYQSPHQVHKALKAENIEMYILIISSDNLNTDHLKILQSIAPCKPVLVDKSSQMIIRQAFSLCSGLYKRTEDKLYFSQLKDSCNTVVALMISHYLKQPVNAIKASRFEKIEKAFTALLDQHFPTLKRPAAYAEKLNISVTYLNECVKNVSGFSVSHHIHQRVVLEAKRLLYYSDKSVKEIASELGYDDYPYFTRLFSKIAGMTALAFRSQHHPQPGA